MKNITTEITINAPAKAVWEALTGLDEYANWNPFVVEPEGKVAVGSRLKVRIQPPGKKVTKFRPTVTVADEGKKFEWLGHLGVRGLFDGRHQFILKETAEGGTRFIQAEEFTGVLVPLFMRILETGTRAGFEAMNQAIKDRVEAIVTGRG
jgi:hypothetical protein